MKTKVSEFADGELDRIDADQVLKALCRDGEARETWRTYHMISDAMRDLDCLSPAFSARFAERLAQEPAVLAPAAVHRGRREWVALSAAASVAAIALVGWLAFAPGQDTVNPTPALATGQDTVNPTPALATGQGSVHPTPALATAPIAAPSSTIERVAEKPRDTARAQAPGAPTRVPLPVAASDYLLAHQGFSPRVSLQGMAPYVRTVSHSAMETAPR